jgi:Zn-dependent peptidase ImmA (M78 family)
MSSPNLISVFQTNMMGTKQSFSLSSNERRPLIMYAHQSQLQDPTTSTLTKLRELTPKDIWDNKAHHANSERQAKLLRKLLGIKAAKFPNEAINQLQMIDVRIDYDLPYSASAYWEDRKWIITLNGRESYLRQRFSLAHEIKHILDHKNKYYLYLDHVGITHNRSAERQADYFAACLLMPRDHVMRLYKMGVTSPTELAPFFEVSPKAMHIRMRTLKLTTRWQRCKLRVSYKVFVMRVLLRVWKALPFPMEIKL